MTLSPPINGRIPPINGSTPVALYQWTLLEGQKPGIPLIKGIATEWAHPHASKPLALYNPATPFTGFSRGLPKVIPHMD